MNDLKFAFRQLLRHPGLRAALTVVAWLASIAVSASAGDAALGSSHLWPQWRGPNAQGVSEAKRLPEKWSATEHVKWKTELPGLGDSSPSIWGDRVFITVAIPEGEPIEPGNAAHPHPSGPMASFPFMRYQFQILCLDRLTGQRIWAQTVPFENPTSTTILLQGNYANATPATDGKVICVYFGMRWLLCYDINGALKWRHEFPDWDSKSTGSDGDSPIVCGDRVVAIREGSAGAAIFAFNKESGETLWSAKRDKDASYASPIIVTVNGKREILVNAKRITAYDYGTGAVVWQCGEMAGQVIPTIVSNDRMVFAASSWGGTGIVEAIKLGRSGDLTTDAIAWSTSKGAPTIATPLLYGNELYAVTDMGLVSCLDANTGELRFDERLPGISSVFASPVAAGGKIYFLGENGRMVILKAGPAFEVLGTNDVSGKFHASPALVDGMILLRSEHDLFCISDSSTVESNHERP